MNKCDCYHIETKRQYTYNPITGDPIGRDVEIGVCWGTKECEECSCGGNEIKCDFYPEVRKKARKEQKPKFGKWISVEDRLPDKSGKYLTYDSKYGDIDMYYYMGCGEWDHHRKGITDAQSHGFTHWQPLPKPPKGE